MNSRVKAQVIESVEFLADHLIKHVIKAMPKGRGIDRVALANMIRIFIGLFQSGKAKVFLLSDEAAESLLIGIVEDDIVTSHKSTTFYWYSDIYFPGTIDAIEHVCREIFQTQKIKLLVPYHGISSLNEKLLETGWQRSHWIIGKSEFPSHSFVLEGLSLHAYESDDEEFVQLCMGDSVLQGSSWKHAALQPTVHIGRQFLLANPSARIAIAMLDGKRVGVMAYTNGFMGPLLPQVSDYILDIYVPYELRRSGLVNGILDSGRREGLLGADGRLITGNVVGHSPKALQSLQKESWSILEEGFQKALD